MSRSRKYIARCVLDNIKNKINEIIDKYDVRSKLLENGAIYYMNGNGKYEQICKFSVFFSESKREFCKAVLNKTGTLVICIYENGEQSPTKKYRYVKFSGEVEALYLTNLLFYAVDDNALYNENLNVIEKEIDKLNIPEHYYTYDEDDYSVT